MRRHGPVRAHCTDSEDFPLVKAMQKQRSAKQEVLDKGKLHLVFRQSSFIPFTKRKLRAYLVILVVDSFYVLSEHSQQDSLKNKTNKFDAVVKRVTITSVRTAQNSKETKHILKIDRRR